MTAPLQQVVAGSQAQLVVLQQLASSNAIQPEN
jgi:hypothetical protein